MSAIGDAGRRGAVVGLLANAFQALVQLGALLVLARHLDAGELGLAALALAAVGLLSGVADLGMGVVTVQREAPVGRRASLVAALAGLLAATALYFAAPAVAAVLGGPTGLAALLRAAVPLPLLAGLSSTARARLARALAFRTIACVDVLVALASAAARVELARRGHGAWALVLGDVAAALLGASLLWLLAPLEPDAGSGPIVADGARVAGTRLLDAAFAQSDRLVVGGALGPEAAGLYAFAGQHAMLLAQRLAPVAEQVALPLFARARSDRAALAAAYLALTRWNALLALPFAAALLGGAPALVAWLYPARWNEAVPALRALAAAAFCAGLNSHPGLVWLALGATRLRLRWSAWNLFALLLVAAAGVRYGLVGAGLALALRSLLATVAAQWLTRRLAGVSHSAYARALLPGALAAAAAGLLGLFASAAFV
jgi:O-antigen/teichoic acid export membrane protein